MSSSHSLKSKTDEIISLLYCFGELKKMYLNFSNALGHLTTNSHDI